MANIQHSYVTLVTNDAYGIGALVLGQSLRNVETSKMLTVMLTSEVSPDMRYQLNQIYDVLYHVEPLDSKDFYRLNLLERPTLGITFTKLHCWKLIQFDKCVFMDADIMVLKNIDDLFKRDELSAVADPGWPDCFNSGLLVIKPSIATFESISKFATENGSFDGADQGLLNMYFSDWHYSDIKKHIPFLYNCVWQCFYSYLPAFKHFGHLIKAVHFIGAKKPWNYLYNLEDKQIDQDQVGQEGFTFLNIWWKLFYSQIYPKLSDDLKSLISEKESAFASDSVQEFNLFSSWNRNITHSQSDFNIDSIHSNYSRQVEWECGNIDYLGADAFHNIKNKIDQVILQSNDGRGNLDSVREKRKFTKSIGSLETKSNRKNISSKNDICRSKPNRYILKPDSNISYKNDNIDSNKDKQNIKEGKPVKKSFFGFRKN